MIIFKSWRLGALMLVFMMLTATVSCGKEESLVEQEQAVEFVRADHSNCTLDSLQIEEDFSGVAIFENVKHEFILDLPESAEEAPLVIMLHGYGESAEGFRQKISFEEMANEKGYAVLYVTGASSPEDPTSSTGWNSGIGVSSNNDVDFLCALANDLCKEYSFDSSRVFAVGFSNGAFMTHRIALEANDIFAAVVSVAGMMPENTWKEKPEECEIGILQITGEKDDVVPKNSDGSANHSKAPAIEDVIDYYIEKNNMSLTEKSDIGKKSVLEKYASAESNKQVWNIFIPDGRHSWPDEQIVGFNTNQIIIDFLETQ